MKQFDLSWGEVKCNLVRKEKENYILSGHVLRGADKPGTRDTLVRCPYASVNGLELGILQIEYSPHTASKDHEHWQAKCKVIGEYIPQPVVKEEVINTNPQ
jgi:hypothetical protein